jgi:hypothetical protein
MAKVNDLSECLPVYEYDDVSVKAYTPTASINYAYRLEHFHMSRAFFQTLVV